jgi:hypothetical protein
MARPLHAPTKLGNDFGKASESKILIPARNRSNLENGFGGKADMRRTSLNVCF